MQWSQVQVLARQGRGQRLDLVTERTSARRLAETLVSLANAEGGTVVLCGRADEGHLPLADPAAARLKALEAQLLCEPRLSLPAPVLVSTHDSGVLLLSVPPNLHQVYSTGGRFLQRRGPLNAPLSAELLARLLSERGEMPFERRTPLTATADDIDWARVGRFAAAIGLHGETDLSQLLTERGGLDATSGRPTHAGLLLFGRQPHRHLPGCEIIAVRYPGETMGDRFLREDIYGPLPDQIERAEAFVLSNMRKGMVLEGIERSERHEYPPAVVREAIVNAVAHRDYAIPGEGIRIVLYSDRIQIYSPGRLAGHVTLENLLEERYSRNQIIVRALADMGHIERLGYGIDRMVALMEAERLPRPAFRETANGFEVMLWGHGSALHPTEESRQIMQRGLSRHAGDHNQRQIRLLELLEEQEQITNSDYQDLCPDVSSETLRRDLAQLVREGLLLKIGRKRGTYYVLR